MKDQADSLRVLARRMGNILQDQIAGDRKRTKVITITSGKGGVGKSNIAVNMSIAMVDIEKKVILLDADLGLANIDVILGIHPTYNLAHVIKGEKSISEIFCEGPKGLKIIPGGSGMHELANLNEWQLQSFLTKLSHLDGLADYLIIDTGAGLSNNVISFSVAADEIIVVTTTEPTSITDAYGIIKTMCQHNYQGVIKLIVNRVKSIDDAFIVYNKLNIAVSRFLQYELQFCGCIREDLNVIKAVQEQSPYIIEYPQSKAAEDTYSLTTKMCEYKYNSNVPKGVTNFFNMVVDYFR